MPTPSRRSNGTTAPSKPPARTTTQSTHPPPLPPQQTTTPPSRLTPLLPTPLETLLLAIYPTTLLLGSLFSLLDPHARSAPYNPTSQSHPPALAPSYFAQKRNLFNILFVKIAWFWVSVAYALFLFLHPSTGPARALVLTPKRLRAVLRWGCVTAWWGVVTQWCFGPALIDRGFRATGGACVVAERFAGQGGAREFWSGQACKAVGGTWKGGHDISGHVFILVLGSAFLGLEILPVIVRGRGGAEERMVVGRGGAVGRVEGDMESGEEGGKVGGLGAPMVVGGLSWWMLLMTAAYFHTWFEKLTGLLVAFLGLFVVYFLPRALPTMRAIIGMPAV